MQRECVKLGGYPDFIKSCLKDQDSVVWFHNRYPNSSQTDVEELTRVEFEGRKKMMITYEFYKKHVPGFENCFIVLSAPQLGTRSSRRVVGEYMLTEKDLESNEVFEDTTIALEIMQSEYDEDFASSNLDTTMHGILALMVEF